MPDMKKPYGGRACCDSGDERGIIPDVDGDGAHGVVVDDVTLKS